MNFLDKKVEEILKNHPSGEDFFNHLDDMIQGHKSIIDAAEGMILIIPWGNSTIEVVNMP